MFIASSTGSTDDPLADLSEVLNTDDDILGILSDDLVKSGDHSGMYVCRVSLVIVSFFFSLYYQCIYCTVFVGYALGHFRYNFHIIECLGWKLFWFILPKKLPKLANFFTWLFALLLKRG